MSQPNSNFSRDPLILGCYFDPKETFFNAGFDDYGVQWSYDSHSPVKALENFIDGVGTYTDIVFPVREILTKDPAVVVNFDKKSFDQLVQDAKKENTTAEALIRKILKVTKIQVFCL